MNRSLSDLIQDRHLAQEQLRAATDPSARGALRCWIAQLTEEIRLWNKLLQEVEISTAREKPIKESTR